MKNKKSGFTLIELLVTVTILTGLLLLGSFSYSLFASKWDKELGNFQKEINLSKSLELINSILTGIQPYIVVNEIQNVKKPGFLFVGTSERLLSITNRSVFDFKYPEIFLFEIINNDKGKKDLLYQAKSTQSFLLLNTSQEIKFENKILLLKDFDKIEMSFYGWDTIIAKSGITANETGGAWRPSFSGMDSLQTPNQIKLVLIKNAKEITMLIQLDEKSLRYLTPYLDQSNE